MITSFAQLLEKALTKGPKRVAIAAAHQQETLVAAAEAHRLGLATAILIGPAADISQLAEANHLDLSAFEIVDQSGDREVCRRAVEMIHQGRADLVMNGRAQPRDLLRAVLDREHGLRIGKLVTDVTVFELPNLDRLLIISDVGVVVSPTLEEKIGIVQNAIDVARALGVEEPKVAILAATEMVNPKIPNSMDAANLSKMAQRGQIQGGIVDGPLALDNAISLEAAQIKSIKSPVAGRADILIAPDVEAGNILAKALTYFAGGKMASVIVGARCPLVMPSRSDPAETKLASLALGIYLSKY